MLLTQIYWVIYNRMSADELKENLRRWIELDDESRRLQDRVKQIRQSKENISGDILLFMRSNNLDDFKLEGQNESTLSRQVRIIKPAVKRNTIRTQLLLHFADQPERVTQALRAIEGIPEGDDGSGIVRQKELLTRRIPKQRQAADISLDA